MAAMFAASLVIALPVNAGQNCTTTCYGSGNLRTCNTNCY
jgi:hypothetical protein